MRAGIAEIDQRPIAHPFGDMAVEARHRRCNRALKRADQIAHVFGIEPRRQRGRADQIAEHHRELPTFGGIAGLRLGQGGRLSRDRRITGKLPDRAQHLQPVPERNTEVLEVLIGQLRQNVAVDFIVAECRFILAEAETSQPIPDIHGGAPTGSAR